MSPSTWTTGPLDAEQRAIVLHVHGADDDALRIAAELAHGLRARDPEAASACLTPKSSWSDRFRAAARLLGTRSTDDAPRSIVVVNPDDLPLTPPGVGEESWDDRAFLTARYSLWTLILSHAQSAEDVIFVRPCPKPELTVLLSANGVVATNEAEDVPADLIPYCRPLARWLLARSVVSEAALLHWVRSLIEPDLSHLVLEAALDALPREAREVLYRMALLRGPQRFNGVVGPFALDGSQGPLSVRRDLVDLLRDAGWLQPAVAHVGLEMPTALRAFLVPRGQLVSDPRVDHREIAAAAVGRIDEAEVPETLEVHHHAVASGDVNLSIQSGRYYLNDLRRLAFDLSVSQADYSAAAKVYRAILESDQRDAYAHEYLAYNLQKARRDDPPSDEILTHFTQAKQLEPNNPLFIGRWLACRASRGENVASELKRLLHRFHQQGLTAVSYLARTPLLKLSRAQKEDVAREWRWLLQRDPELRALLP